MANVETNSRYATMLGLFVASSSVGILSNIAVDFASDHNWPKTAKLIKNASPFVQSGFDFLKRIESKKQLSVLEQTIGKELLEIKEKISMLNKKK
jgi:hypothetical protein